MIKRRPAGERGKTRTDWLDSNHTFSFNRYYDPRWSGFRNLLVINEDFVAPDRGFGTHSHNDMEIISYVIAGELAHKDSTGTSSVIRPDEVQRMSAGTGVSHSEFNPSHADSTHFLQIWIEPETQGLEPSYEQRLFPKEQRSGKLRLLASRDGRDSSVVIHQDVRLYDALLAPGGELSYQLGSNRHGWIQVVSGTIAVNGIVLAGSDGAAISQEDSIHMQANEDSEILLFDLV